MPLGMWNRLKLTDRKKGGSKIFWSSFARIWFSKNFSIRIKNGEKLSINRSVKFCVQTGRKNIRISGGARRWNFGAPQVYVFCRFFLPKPWARRPDGLCRRYCDSSNDRFFYITEYQGATEMKPCSHCTLLKFCLSRLESRLLKGQCHQKCVSARHVYI